MSKDLDQIHQESIKRFDQEVEVAREEREQMLEDRRFCYVAGAMWEGKYLEYFKNKPRLELNKVYLAVQRVINEYRANRITVNFVSKDGRDDDQLADTCDMLYRSDEQYSCSEEAYDTAFDEGVTGGMGAWRLRSEYEDEYDEDNDRQRILFEPITDSETRVFFGAGAKRQDKSDAKEAWVLNPIPTDEYIETWDDDPDSWSQDLQYQNFDWVTPDLVYVAEYYKVEEVKESVYTYQTIDNQTIKYTEKDFEVDEELEEYLAATGHEFLSERKVKTRKVRKYIMSGSGVLEDCGYIAGTEIPIVVFYGRRNYIENIERASGVVRFAKDVQRVINGQYSKLLEFSSLSSVSKPILPYEMVARHENTWNEDNLEDFAFLPIDPLVDQHGNIIATAPTGYTKPPEVPPALAALLQISEADIKDILGNPEQGEKMLSNVSGKAYDMVQTQITQQSHIYMTNFAKAMKRCGEIWLSMARDIYIEPGRRMKGIGSQEEMTTIELMKPVKGDKGTEYENDLSNAKFDVAVDVGASSSTKKRSIVNSLTEMIPLAADPETKTVLTSMAIMNMEGEGIQDVKGFFRDKMVKMGVVKPTDEELQELQEAASNIQPDPQAQYLQAAAQKEMMQAEKYAADTELSYAKAGETRAKTIETLSEIENSSRESAINTAQGLQQVAATGSTTPLQVGE